MAGTFDFEAFISLPSQGEVVQSIVPNGANPNVITTTTDSLGNPIITNANDNSLLGPANDMISSFPDQGMSSGLESSSHQYNGGIDMMSSSTLMSQSNSMM